MGRMRSPNYPNVGLSFCIEYLRKIWNRENRTPVPGEVLASHMGYQTLSGPARVRIAALKQYGLIEGNEKTGMRISDLGLRIIHPENVEDEDQAKKSAALNPELFREMFETHARASEAALKSVLINRHGFSETGARRFSEAFRDTLSVAMLNDTQYNGLQNSESEKAMEQTTTHSATAQQRVETRQFSGHSGGDTVYNWPLSSSVTAYVRISGGPLKGSHLERLKKYLDLAGDFLESDSEDKQEQ